MMWLTINLLSLSFSILSCSFFCSLSTIAWWLITALLSLLIRPMLLRWNSLKSRACCSTELRYSCSEGIWKDEKERGEGESVKKRSHTHAHTHKQSNNSIKLLLPQWQSLTITRQYLNNRTCYDEIICTVLFSSRWWVYWYKLFSVLRTLQKWQNLDKTSSLRGFCQFWVFFHNMRYW